MAGRDGAFAGAWQDDEGTVVVVKDSRMYGPDGGQLDLKITSRTECSGHDSHCRSFLSCAWAQDALWKWDA